MTTFWWIALIASCAVVIFARLLRTRSIHSSRAGIRALVALGYAVIAIAAMVLLYQSILTLPAPVKWLLSIALAVGFALVFLRADFGWLVPEASAEKLALVRIVTCSILLFLAAKDSLTSTLIIPEGHQGVSGLIGRALAAWPVLYDTRDALTLGVTQWLAVVALAFATLGLFTRVSLAIAALSYALMYSALISYTHFFHMGLVPLYFVMVLIFVPCADVWSVDSVLRKQRGGAITTAPASYQLSFFLILLIYGISYFLAAMSKWKADPFWGTALNLEYITLNDTLTLIDLPWNLTPAYVAAGGPHWAFGLLGIGALVVETLGLLIIFAPSSRRLVAFSFFGLHLGILVIQEVCFWDLLLVPLIFVPVRLIQRYLPASRHPAEPEPEAPAPATRKHKLRFAVAAGVIASTMFSGWLYHIDEFPFLTSWNMYARSNRPTRARYLKLYEVRAEGGRVRTDPSRYVEAMGDARWTDLVRWPRNKRRKKHLQRLLSALAVHANHSRKPDDRIVAFELEQWRWNFYRAAERATRGYRRSEIRLPVLAPEEPTRPTR